MSARVWALRYTGIKIPLDTSLLCISFYIKLCDECVYISQKLLLQIFRFLASFNFLYRFYKIFIHLTIVGAGETLKTWCNLSKIWDREKSCAMDGNNLSPPLLMLFVSIWDSFLAQASVLQLFQHATKLIGGRGLTYFCKVNHSRISGSLSRNWFGLYNLCAILQENVYIPFVKLFFLSQCIYQLMQVSTI